MLAGINEDFLKSEKHKVKVRYIPGNRTSEMYNYMKPLLRKLPDDIVLQIGRNDSLDNASKKLKQLLQVKKMITHLVTCWIIPISKKITN